MAESKKNNKVKNTNKKVEAKPKTEETKTTKKEIKADKKEVKTDKVENKKEITKNKEEVNKETKTNKKEAEKETKKVIVKKKFIAKEKKANKTKSNEAKENQKLLVEKKKLPTFRGRFGKKNIRKKSIKKWQKWRKPRSIDLDRGLQHGFRPKIGYRNKAKIRDIHPSGYLEIKVANVNDLEKVNIKTQAIRIGATVGKRKRNEIIKKANEKGIWVLN